MSRRSNRWESFTPLQDKTLANVLLNLFTTEFGYEHKRSFAQVIVTRLLDVLTQFLQPTTVLQPGQLLWMAVAHDGRKHAHQFMREIPQVPVILDLLSPQDLAALAQGQPGYEVRRQRFSRLLEQAFAQGGVLAQADLAALALVSVAQVSEDLRAVNQRTQRLLPYRGSVQDVGLTLTHKVNAVRLYEQGHLEPAICELLTPRHSLEAVERYLQAYKNVTKLLRYGLSPAEISAILPMSERLVAAYVEIVREHHPEIIAQNLHLCAKKFKSLRSCPGAK